MVLTSDALFLAGLENYRGGHRNQNNVTTLTVCVLSRVLYD
jgi:hypothetical protein